MMEKFKMSMFQIAKLSISLVANQFALLKQLRLCPYIPLVPATLQFFLLMTVLRLTHLRPCHLIPPRMQLNQRSFLRTFYLCLILFYLFSRMGLIFIKELQKF